MTDKDRNSRIAPEDREDAMLEAYFAAGRSEAPKASAALLARVAADAAGVQAGWRQAPAARTMAAPQRRPWQDWLAMLRARFGGGLAVGGLAMATAVGVWIGAQPPELLLDMEARLFGDVIVIEFGEDLWGLDDI